MALVSLDHARAGMTLAGDALDRRGRLLVPAGKELTERHIEALRMWGVPHLEVEGDGPEAEAETPIHPDTLAQAEAEVQELFFNAAGAHPFLDMLRALSVDRRARELTGVGR